MSENPQSQYNGRRYWRSLDELAAEPAFKEHLHREFPQGASELEGVNRRHFVKIMAASFALAGVGISGCRRPEQRILPYGTQPERMIQGQAIYYATSQPGAKDNLPLLVETHQARPTKIEGNDEYAPYGGSTDVFAQADVLNLYDPDRSTASYHGTEAMSAEEATAFVKTLADRVRLKGGQGVAFLAERSTSPTRARLVREIKSRYPNAVWAEYTPATSDNPEIACERVFGERLRPIYRLEKAKRILTLAADFVKEEPGKLLYSRDFAKGRSILDAGDATPESMNRLYSVEADFTLTGGMADHRLRLNSSQIRSFAALIASRVMEAKGQEVPGQVSEEAGLFAPGEGNVDAMQWAEECARDLAAHEGESVVFVGSAQPPEVHQLGFLINSLLGGIGETVDFVAPEEEPAEDIGRIAEMIGNDEVGTLVIVGGNPAYDAPGNLQWKTLQAKVKQNPRNEVVRLGYYYNESSLPDVCDYHIAQSHYLESWGDGRALDGTYLPVQPMIHPLFDSLSELEFLSHFAGVAADAFELVKQTFNTIGEGGDKNFERFLGVGVLPNSAYEPKSVSVDAGSALSGFTPNRPVVPGALEVVIKPSAHVGDGRYNNNGWCQELPDPMTKLTWDNAIAVSPARAAALGYDLKKTFWEQIGGDGFKVAQQKGSNLELGRQVAPLVELKVGNRSVQGPLFIQPGLADETIVVTLGYGRWKTGRVGAKCGYDAYRVSGGTTYGYRTGATLSRVDETRMLANTQLHWSMEGRAIIREANVETFHEDHEVFHKMGMESHTPAPLGAKQDYPREYTTTHQPRGNSLFQHPPFPDENEDGRVDARELAGNQQWGMTIDLNACTSCSACVIACQSENNIPVVGRNQVIRGREMHWIRIDRYYSSGSLEDVEGELDLPSDPQVNTQPVTCMHCETAPCEQVCPVNATVHDEEGLNVMAYNRCVGTRYCNNNCPYKVRRFNFFDYNKRDIEELYQGPLGELGRVHEMDGMPAMQKNPDVSIRMRGVMEKCTFCVQRIQEAKIHQKIKARDTGNVKVPDGVITPACAQVCPTDAIVFGDVADPDTAVSRIKDSGRNYDMLGYLNTRPRTSYLARLRNPNVEMPIPKNIPPEKREDYWKTPWATKEYDEKSGHGGGHGEGAPHHEEESAH